MFVTYFKENRLIITANYCNRMNGNSVILGHHYVTHAAVGTYGTITYERTYND